MSDTASEASTLEAAQSLRLGPLRGRSGTPPAVAPWGQRLREAVSSFMPILAMVALALASWWLVKNSPRPLQPTPEQPLRTEPDYTMSGFALERFAADGRLKLRIEGQEMRHIPATDRIEIDGVRIRAIAPDGRVLAQLPPFTAGALRVEAQGFAGLTPYVRWGDALALLLAIAAILPAFLAAYRRRRSR